MRRFGYCLMRAASSCFGQSMTFQSAARCRSRREMMDRLETEANSRGGGESLTWPAVAFRHSGAARPLAVLRRDSRHVEQFGRACGDLPIPVRARPGQGLLACILPPSRKAELLGAGVILRTDIMIAHQRAGLSGRPSPRSFLEQEYVALFGSPALFSSPGRLRRAHETPGVQQRAGLAWRARRRSRCAL